MNRRLLVLRATAASAVFAALSSLPCVAHAQVPAGYTGTPFMGTPWPIPGRIDFENYDDGGQDVGWRVDDHTGNFGVGGCAGNTYRTDMPHPQICMTNPVEGDVYSEGPLVGMPYPTDGSGSMYIGYTHNVDWVRLTVNVAQAGTYALSSTWGSEPGGEGGIQFQVLFNDVLKADVSLTGTGGYHNWVVFDDFATVELEAGVQVLQFAVKSMHLNYDYLQLSLMLPGGGVDDGSGGAAGQGGSGGGGAGAGGATAEGGAGGTAGVAQGGQGGEAVQGGQGGAPVVVGLAGTTSTGGGGAAPVAAGAGGQPSGAAGAPIAAAGAATDPTLSDPNAGSAAAETQSGCSISVSQRSVGAALLWGVLALALASLRRERS